MEQPSPGKLRPGIRGQITWPGCAEKQPQNPLPDSPALEKGLRYEDRVSSCTLQESLGPSTDPCEYPEAQITGQILRSAGTSLSPPGGDLHPDPSSVCLPLEKNMNGGAPTPYSDIKAVGEPVQSALKQFEGGEEGGSWMF